MSAHVVRFLARCIVFLTVVAAAWILVLFSAVNIVPGGLRGLVFTNIPREAPTVGGPTSYMFEELGNVGEVDVLWVGSSHVYRTFDPRFFDRYGLRTFNLGTTAQTPLNTYYLLHEHVDRFKPRVIVMEIYWLCLCTDGVESLMDLVANTKTSHELVRMAFATHDVRAINSVLRRTFDLRRPPISSRQPNFYRGDRYIGRGFVEKASSFRDMREWERRPLHLRDSQLRYLRFILELARGRQIEIALVVQPLPPQTLEGIPNRREISESLRELARQHDVAYIDFNDFLQLDPARHFFDNNHLSQAGLEVFLPEFYARMVAMGVFEPQDPLDQLPESYPGSVRIESTTKPPVGGPL